MDYRINMHRTTAKGKIFLLGEYSVLFGGIGIIATINRYAISSFMPDHHLSFTAITNNIITSIDHPLFTETLSVLAEKNIMIPKGSYTLDSQSFFHNHEKIGLGSSAAAMVALLRMIFSINNIFDINLLIDIAKKAHHRFNHGGSGADIMASIKNNAIIYQKDDETKALTLPSVLSHLIVINTKKSQSTSNYIKIAYDWAHKHHHILHNIIDQSNDICYRLIDKYNLSIDELINIINDAYNLLLQWGQMMNINIISKEHEEIHNIALYHHGGAKPSGAGGGDIAIAMIPYCNKDAFIKHIFMSGFDIIDVKLS